MICQGAFAMLAAFAMSNLVGIAQGKQLILTTAGNKFEFDGMSINIDLLYLRNGNKYVVNTTGYKLPFYFLDLVLDIRNTGNSSETVNPDDDIRIIAGSNSFAPHKQLAPDPDYLKDIEPASTRMRACEVEIPKVVLGESFLIRVKAHDVRVQVSKLGTQLPVGASYAGPKEE